MRRIGLLLWLALGCASAPDPVAPGTTTIWGQVTLAPRAGVTPGAAGSGSYGDRRMSGVEFVDYSRTGFAVVFAADDRPDTGVLELAIRDSRVGTRVEPEQAAVGSAGRISLHNGSDRAHVVSYPAGGLVRRVAAGETTVIDVAAQGEQSVFLLDVPNAEATIFGAPGTYSVVSAAGRYVLEDLEPGSREIHVWHPRFPPASRRVELTPDERLEVDFALGVGRGEHVHAH